MTQLKDPHQLSLAGEPMLGRAAPRVFIFGELTPSQRGALAAVYKTFCDAKLTAPGQHAVLDRVMPDGTRVRMVPLGNQDLVLVWPVRPPVPLRLPHTFVAVTNWAQPTAMRRLTTPSVSWLRDKIEIPQAAADIAATNQVFRNAGTSVFFNHPMVLNSSTPRKTWDYMPHAAPTISGVAPSVPICLAISGAYSTQPTHYARENTVFDEEGNTLYTMPLSTPILVDPETPVLEPPGTTSDGTQLALQHIRTAVIAPTFGTYRVKFANERLTRTASETYAVAERNETSIDGPLGGSTPATAGAASTLGEAVTGIYVEHATVVAGVAWSAGSGVYGFQYNVFDLSTLTTTSENAYRIEQTYAADSPTTLAKSLALPEDIQVRYPNLSISPGASGSEYWRAGYKQIAADPYSTTINTYRWFGLYSIRKDRIDTNYSRITAPLIKYELGWTDFKLLEGSSSGSCAGGTYTDTESRGRHTSWWEGYYFALAAIVFDPGPTTGDVGTWMMERDKKGEVVDRVAPFNNVTVSTTIRDDRPVNTGSYNLISRYLIDFDQRGRFYAAIRVEVECSGARWQENRAVYDGFMIADGTPTYTVRIYLETNWNGVVNSSLLTTATASRPAFEFTTLSKQNPYYFLFPLLTDKQTMLVRLPPSFGLPYAAMAQVHAFCSHQGVNTNVACADVRTDIVGDGVALTQSVNGLEHSETAPALKPHSRYVTGQLYARSFKLSDFPGATWMLSSTKCDATENDNPLAPGATAWFYMPALGATISGTTFHVEVRDGVHETWSDDITPDAPALTAREIKLYRV